MIYVAHILECTDEDTDVSHAEEYDGGDGACRGTRCSITHRKPEQAGGQEAGADHCGIESVLGRGSVGRESAGHTIIADPGAEVDYHDAEDAAERDRQEHEAGLLEGEVMSRLEHPEEDAEEDEEYAEYERDVQR